MAGLYGASGGVNRLPKQWYSAAGGVNRQLKEIYSVDGGVNRKIYSSAVKWTYAYRYSSGAASAYDISSAYSAHLVSGNNTGGVIGGYEFTFTEPLVLPAGTVIRMYAECSSYSNVPCSVFADSSQVVNTKIAVATANYISASYTVPTDITVSKIFCQIAVPYTSKSDRNNATEYVYIKLPGSTEFLLNNSGTSENQ